MSLFSRRGHNKSASLLIRSLDDPALFADFYRAYSRRVVGYFLRRSLDPDTALDLTAETFSVALERRRQFRGNTPEEEQGWLFAIARSQLSLYVRRGRIEREAATRLAIATPRWTADELQRVEDLAGSTVVRHEAAAILNDLPEPQRAAIVMRVLDDLGYDEIAKETDVSEDVIRARVSRGLRRMRDSMSDAALAEQSS